MWSNRTIFTMCGGERGQDFFLCFFMSSFTSHLCIGHVEVLSSIRKTFQAITCFKFVCFGESCPHDWFIDFLQLSSKCL